jgi:hypothetical protein
MTDIRYIPIFPGDIKPLEDALLLCNENSMLVGRHTRKALAELLERYKEDKPINK